MTEDKILALKSELGDKFQVILQKLSQIWDDIGICETKRDERLRVVMHHLENLLEEMYSEEESLKIRLQKSVDKCTAEVQNLCTQLSLASFDVDTSISLLKLEGTLRKKVEELTKVKQHRLEMFENLNEDEAKLCHYLAIPRLNLTSPELNIPSLKELEELSQHVTMLKEEKMKRLDLHHAMKASIKDLMHSLEYSPNTTLECDLVCEDEESLILSADYMKDVESLLKMLKNTEENYQHESDKLRDCLKTLWERLNTEQAERDEFLILNAGYKPSTIAILRNEVERCEELKRQNIKHYILKIRSELNFWWEKCYISKEQRKEFAYYNDDTFSEGVLEVHEAEVQKLKDYYEINKEMFTKVHKREELWEKMIQFEKNASDPKRFNNRGGCLLQEEQERKKLLTKLPKLEEELSSLIAAWEFQSQQKFYVNGMRFLDYIESQWAQHRQGKEEEKMERKRIRAKQIENEVVHGIKGKVTPIKRLGVNTPTNKTKRLLTNQNSTLAAKHKITGNSGCLTPKAGSSSAPRARNLTVLRERNQMNNSGFSITTISEMTNKAPDHTFTSSMASYSEFSNDLNAKSRDNCRSSLVSPAVRMTTRNKRPQTPIRKSSRLSLKKTPRTPISSKKSPGRHLTKSPGIPLRHNLGLPFLI